MSCSVSVSWSSTCRLQWFAICLSDVGDYEGIKVKIGNSYIIREHLEVKCSLGLKHQCSPLSEWNFFNAHFYSEQLNSIQKMRHPSIFLGTGELWYRHTDAFPLETSSNTTLVSFSQVFRIFWITVVPAESCSRYFCVASDCHLWRGQRN